MARAYGRLTARKVATAGAGMHADGGGLYLQVTNEDAKSWIYRFSLQGRAREMGLGSVRDFSLVEARDKAAACRRLARDGIDPIEHRRATRAKEALATVATMTFRESSTSYIEAHRAGWRNAKHADQWTATLKAYAYPVLGAVSVQAVDVGLVLKVIEPIWATKPETAGRVRGRIESILDWAKARGYRDGENPARWQGHLDHLLPKRSKVARVKHHPALPYADIPAFMAGLRARDGMSARALEFAVLTAARTGAVIGATLDEIDLGAKVWKVPPERIGTKIVGDEPKPHRVPLCRRAVEILKAVLPRENGNPYVFIGGKAGQPLSNMAMLELLRELRPGLTVHGFRSSFKDWAAETTNYPNIVSEMALAHAISDDVEAAYRRGDLFEKRRRLMDAWGEFCAKSAAVRGDVIALRGA